MTALAHNRRLAVVMLDGCGAVSDSSVAALARLCPLAELSLGVGGGPGMPHLSAFGMRALSEDAGGTTLTKLSLQGWATDAALLALCERCTRLERLDVRGSAKLTDSGLLAAAQPGALSALQSLSIDEGNSLLSKEAVRQVRAAFGP